MKFSPQSFPAFQAWGNNRHFGRIISFHERCLYLEWASLLYGSVQHYVDQIEARAEWVIQIWEDPSAFAEGFTRSRSGRCWWKVVIGETELNRLSDLGVGFRFRPADIWYGDASTWRYIYAEPTISPAYHRLAS